MAQQVCRQSFWGCKHLGAPPRSPEGSIRCERRAAGRLGVDPGRLNTDAWAGGSRWQSAGPYGAGQRSGVGVAAGWAGFIGEVRVETVGTSRPSDATIAARIAGVEAAAVWVHARLMVAVLGGGRG